MTAIATFGELKTALSLCKGGEVLELVSGDMPTARLNMIRKFSPPVTIKGNNTRFVGMFQVEDIDGLTFDGVDMKVNATEDYHWCIRFYRCANIEFVRGGFEGTIVPAAGDVPDYRMGFGIMGLPAGTKIRWCKFRNLSRACSFGGGGIVIEDNDVWNCSEGFQGSNSKVASFKRNSFRDFRPKPGDHPDAIQLLGSSGPNSAQDIIVKDNLFSSLLGRGMQGFFVRNEYKHAHLSDPTVPYNERITAEDNLILGGYYNGIMIEDTLDTLIQRNRVYHIEGDDDIPKVWIRVGAGTGTVKDNQAHTYMGVAAPYVTSNNTLLPTISRADAQALEDAWFAKFRPVAAPVPVPAPDPQAQIDALEAEIATLNAQIVTLNSTISTGNTSLAAATTELASVKIALADEKQSTVLLTEKVATLQARVDVLELALRNIRSTVASVIG